MKKSLLFANIILNWRFILLRFALKPNVQFNITRIIKMNSLSISSFFALLRFCFFVVVFY